MKTLLRSAAVAVASIALVAGGATSATAAPGDAAAVTSVSLQPTATYYASTPINGSVIYGDPNATSGAYGLKATVNVNGVPVANGVSIRPTGFYYERAWGAGTVTLTNFTLSGYDRRPTPTGGVYTDKPVPGPANAVQVRYAIDNNSSIRVTKRGKKLTIRLKARYINNAGRAIGLRKATIQVKKNGKWKNLKHVNLKKNGTATYKRTDGKKRNYRMLIKTTSLVQGGNTTGTRKL